MTFPPVKAVVLLLALALCAPPATPFPAERAVQLAAAPACCLGCGTGPAPCCCPARPRTVTRTAFRTRTLTRTVTPAATGRLAGRHSARGLLDERDVVPEPAGFASPDEPPVSADGAEVGSHQSRLAQDEIPNADSSDTFLGLFPRNLCPPCPAGIAPAAPGARAKRYCCPARRTSTRFLSRTRTRTVTRTVRPTYTLSLRLFADRDGNGRYDPGVDAPAAGLRIVAGPVPSARLALGGCPAEAVFDVTTDDHGVAVATCLGMPPRSLLIAWRGGCAALATVAWPFPSFGFSLDVDASGVMPRTSTAPPAATTEAISTSRTATPVQVLSTGTASVSSTSVTQTASITLHSATPSSTSYTPSTSSETQTSEKQTPSSTTHTASTSSPAQTTETQTLSSTSETVTSSTSRTRSTTSESLTSSTSTSSFTSTTSTLSQTTASCVPKSCFDQSFECGAATDGCGSPIDCGGCPYSAEQCESNHCTYPRASCAAGSETTLRGVVRAPNGADPVAGAFVYVPLATLDPFGVSVGCDSCDYPLPGNHFVRTTSAWDGAFTLSDVPYGASIPLVVQIGKWRRVLTFDVLDGDNCTSISLNPRLPRNQNEGDIPRIAVVSAGSDYVECAFRHMGVDDSEFVSPFPGTGRIHIYTGTGGVLAPGIWPATPEVQLWSQLHVLKQYDMVVVGCSGTADETFPDEHSGKVAEYLDSGGRLFISHQGYPWLNRPSTMIAPMVEWDPNRADPPDGFATVDTNAAGGPQLASWLVAAGAVASPGTRVPLNRMSNEVARIDAPARTVLRANLGGGATADVDFVFEFPAGAGMPCGRVRFVQFHAYYFGNTATRFPTECPTGASTPAQKVVQHMLYDLGRCI